MKINVSYLHRLRDKKDIDQVVQYLRENPKSPIFLHPMCPSWIQDDFDLINVRSSFLVAFSDLDRSSVRNHYNSLLQEANEYSRVCELTKKKNLALYCINPKKVSMPDTLEQFYKYGNKYFEMYRNDRFQWIYCSIEDYWCLDILPDVLALNKVVNDVMTTKVKDKEMNDLEWDAYWKIQWSILAACFSLADYKLGFEKLNVLKDQHQSDELLIVIKSCFDLINRNCQLHWMNDFYETFNYIDLIQRLESINNSEVYLNGVHNFGSILKRIMLIGYLNITKRIQLTKLAKRFGSTLEEIEIEVGWLIITFQMPFIIDNGTISLNKADHENEEYLLNINKILDNNIIQGNALKTSSLINMSFD